MKFFLKSLVMNFLIIFFVDYLAPDIDVMHQTKIPHIEGDLLFPIGLALLNSLVYPVLKTLQQAHIGKIALSIIVITFASYAILKFAPLGIGIMSVKGYLIAASVVSVIGILIGYLEMKHAQPRPPEIIS